MAPPLRVPLGACAAVAALVLGALGLAYAGQSEPHSFDRWLQSAVPGLLSESRQAALAIDFAASPTGSVFVLFPVTLILLLSGRWRLAVVALAGSSLSVVMTFGLKPVIGRTIHDAHLAFPSGHTAFATAIALVFGLLAADLLKVGRPAGVGLVLVSASVGGAVMALSQIVLGSHYPTDTIGGFCTAVAVIPLMALLVDRIAVGSAPD